MAEPWVSVEQITEHLGVARDSICNSNDHKGKPARQLGRLRQFRASEVESWIHMGGAEAKQGGAMEEPVGHG